MKQKQQKTNSWFLASLVCLLASSFYLYEFILQVSPGVMTHELMRAYSVGAAGLGTISAFYYYAYTPMQVPAGILFDRFGPRILLTIASFICAIGAFFFGFTHSAIVASYGRFLMGFGSSFAFIGVLVLLARWFPARYFALLAGIAQSMSSVGAIFGGAPLAKAVLEFGWRQSIIWLGVIGFVLTFLIWLVVRDHPPGQKLTKTKSKIKKVKSLEGLKLVISNGQTWFIAIYSFAVWAPIVIFAALWGIPYLKMFYTINTTVASSAIAMVWIGIGIGSPLIGWVSDKMQRRCFPLTVSAAIGIASTLVILYVPHLSYWLMYIALLGLGLAASGQSLSFGLIKDITKPELVGTAVGFNNMAVVAGGAFFQPLVGFLLHYFWNGAMVHGVPMYNITAYRDSLWLLPACFVLAIILSMVFIKETQCRPSFNKM